MAEAEEAEAPEEPEDPTADPVPDKKAYASVFMGWSLEDGCESFIPQWTAGTSIAVADLTNAARCDGSERCDYNALCGVG